MLQLWKIYATIWAIAGWMVWLIVESIQSDGRYRKMMENTFPDNSCRVISYIQFQMRPGCVTMSTKLNTRHMHRGISPQKWCLRGSYLRACLLQLLNYSDSKDKDNQFKYLLVTPSCVATLLKLISADGGNSFLPLRTNPLRAYAKENLTEKVSHKTIILIYWVYLFYRT